MRLAALLLFAAPLLQAQDWPQFRGPDGQGHSDVKRVPTEWSDSSANLKWKTPIEGLGWSSPVVGDGKIWLTTATEGGKSLRAVCVDESTGKELHNVEVVKLPATQRIHQKNSHASPTPILDGDRVYVHFGPYGTAALSKEGKIVWKQELKYSPVHGSGGSPALYKELLVICCDGSDKQFVVALNRKDGKIRWQVPRPELSIPKRFAFCTPLVIDVNGKPQIVCPGAGIVTSHDPDSGRILWQAKYGDGFSNVPRPVYGHGMIFLSSGFDEPTFLAIRVDGKGDVTDTHVAWKLTKNAPLEPSPILVGDELYLVNDRGIASCVDAKKGTVYWSERVGNTFCSSPLYAGGNLYFVAEDGLTTVVKPGKTFSKVAQNKVSGRTFASLAPVEGALFLRTDTQLIRIEADAK